MCMWSSIQTKEFAHLLLEQDKAHCMHSGVSLGAQKVSLCRREHEIFTYMKLRM